jgi:hypothetical protein
MYKEEEDDIVINTGVVRTYPTLERPYQPVWQRVKRTFRRTPAETFSGPSYKEHYETGAPDTHTRRFNQITICTDYGE